MIQIQTKLKINDNSGIKIGQCIIDPARCSGSTIQNYHIPTCPWWILEVQNRLNRTRQYTVNDYRNLILQLKG